VPAPHADTPGLQLREMPETVEHRFIQPLMAYVREARRGDARRCRVGVHQFVRVDAAGARSGPHGSVHRAIRHQIREGEGAPR
jgi:hypothetical protein